MSMVPREVREERLRRFLDQQSKLSANIARMQELVSRIEEAEPTETDREKLYQYAVTKGTLKKQIPESQALLLRTIKSVEHEKELLARYDLHGGDAGPDESEREDGPVAREEACLIGDIDGMPAAPNGTASSGSVSREALEKIHARSYGEITLNELEHLMDYHARLVGNPNRTAAEESVKRALDSALDTVDVKLDALRHMWSTKRAS